MLISNTEALLIIILVNILVLKLKMKSNKQLEQHLT